MLTNGAGEELMIVCCLLKCSHCVSKQNVFQPVGVFSHWLEIGLYASAPRPMNYFSP